MISCAIGQSSQVCIPGGLPFRLWPGADMMIEVPVPPDVTALAVTVTTEAGTANGHMSLFAMPITAGGADGSRVGSQLDGALSVTANTTFTIVSPSGTKPTPYLVRFWIDHIERTADSGTPRADKIPVAVVLLDVSMSTATASSVVSQSISGIAGVTPSAGAAAGGGTGGAVGGGGGVGH